VKEIQVYSIEGPGHLQRGDNHKNVRMGWGHLKVLFLRKAEFYMINNTSNMHWLDSY
jgi:hypothetical protein